MFSAKLRTTALRPILVLLLAAVIAAPVDTSNPACAQIRVPGVFPQPSDTQASDLGQRCKLAFELAETAARAGLFDLSVEAVRRVTTAAAPYPSSDGSPGVSASSVRLGATPQSRPATGPGFQSSLLGNSRSAGASSTGSLSFSLGTSVAPTTRLSSGGSTSSRPAVPAEGLDIRTKMTAILATWKQTHAPPEKIALLLRSVVMPSGLRGRLQLVEEPEGNPSYTFDANLNAPIRPPAVPSNAGFELVDWSYRAAQLEPLIATFKTRAGESSRQNADVALLIYALRVAGEAEAAASWFEKFLLERKLLKGQSKLILIALKRPLPENVNEKMDQAVIDDFIMRIARLDGGSPLARALATDVVLRAVEQNDGDKVVRYLVVFDSIIEQLNATDSPLTSQLQARFRASLQRECRRLGHVDLAVELAVRSPEVATSSGQYTWPLEERLITFAAGPSDQRLSRARRLLAGPLESGAQFGFVELTPVSRPPDFFRAEDRFDEPLALFKPFAKSHTASLLDLLLNEAEAQGKLPTTVGELLDRARGNDDVTRLLARWIMLRAEKRGQRLDAKIAEMASFSDEDVFFQWWKKLPAPAAAEILAAHVAKTPMSATLLRSIEQFLDSPSGRHFANSIVLSEILCDAPERLVPPRPIASLKHWIVKEQPSSWSTSPVLKKIWTVPVAADAQPLVYRNGTIMLRYPLSGNFWIKGTFTSDKRPASLGMNGLWVMLNSTGLDEYYGLVSGRRNSDARYGSAPEQVPLGGAKVLGWKSDGKSLVLTLDDRGAANWDQRATAFPFFSCAWRDWNSRAPEDFSITGELQIPRSVALIDTSLSGWDCSLFPHSLPSARAAFKSTGLAQLGNGQVPPTAPANYDTDISPSCWRVRAGELRVGQPDSSQFLSPYYAPAAAVAATANTETASSATASTATATGATVKPEAQGGATTGGVTGRVESQGPELHHQTLLSYGRPLLEGERIDFELFHDDKLQTASPVVGRIAYFLGGADEKGGTIPGKVILHWIASADELARLTLPENNHADDPLGEQLAAIELQDGSWNRVAVRIENRRVVLSIGDKDVYRRPLGEEETPMFGLFADPTGAEARIRNIVLRGDWPAQLPQDLWELQEK